MSWRLELPSKIVELVGADEAGSGRGIVVGFVRGSGFVLFGGFVDFDDLDDFAGFADFDDFAHVVDSVELPHSCHLALLLLIPHPHTPLASASPPPIYLQTTTVP